MPSDVLFIADEEVAEKGKYLLRNTFSSFKNCEAVMEDNQDGDLMEKKGSSVVSVGEIPA